MKKSVNYEAGAYIWLTLGSPKREPYKISQQHLDDIQVFQEWLWKNKINYRTRISGGGIWDGLIEIDDWEKVETFLMENGFPKGSTSLSKEIEV